MRRAFSRWSVFMDLGLQGKTALVLGGGGGLGSAIAMALGREGVHVAIADVDAAALDRAVRDVTAAGSKGFPLQWDLADLSVIDSRVKTIEHELGTVDIL